VAETGQAAAFHGTPVDGAVLADDIAIADLEPRGLAPVGDVLRRVAERAELEHAIVAPDAGRAAHHHVRAEPGAVADLDVGPDDGVGTDLDPLAETRPRIDHRGGMDRGSAHIPLYVHISSAWQHTSPSTRAVASNSQMPLILRLIATSSRSWSPGPTVRLKRALSMPTK